MEKTARVSVLLAVLFGASMAWAAEPSLWLPIPDGMERWTVVALMALLSILSLSLSWFCVWRAFACVGQINTLVAQGDNMGRRMDEIASKVGGVERKPCGLETPAFREYLREVFKELKG
jgi:hypothetical protein